MKPGAEFSWISCCTFKNTYGSMSENIYLVSGEHPIMKPGAEFSWISCCTFKNTYGSMSENIYLVSGEHPIMKPGAEFSWISCCTFKNTYGSMSGHFKMRNLLTGRLLVNIAVEGRNNSVITLKLKIYIMVVISHIYPVHLF